MCACVHAWQHHLQLDTLWQAASPLCAFLTGEAEVTAVLSWSGCCRGMRHKGLPVLPVLVTAPQAHAVSFLTSTRRATKDKAAPPPQACHSQPSKAAPPAMGLRARIHQAVVENSLGSYPHPSLSQAHCPLCPCTYH